MASGDLRGSRGGCFWQELTTRVLTSGRESNLIRGLPLTHSLAAVADAEAMTIGEEGAEVVTNSIKSCFAVIVSSLSSDFGLSDKWFEVKIQLTGLVLSTV